MTIKSADADRASQLLSAMLQRHEVIQNLADTLAKRTIWRAPHGAIAVIIPAPELAQLEQLVRSYLAEAATVHEALSVLFPPEEP